MKLSDCIPATKFDTTAIENAASLGFPTINPILSELLEWVKDGNWPVANGVLVLLAQAGPEIAPHINAIFGGDDEEWKYFILSGLVKNLKPEVAELLRPSVIRMARDPDVMEKAAEVDKVACDVLDHWSRLEM